VAADKPSIMVVGRKCHHRLPSWSLVYENPVRTDLLQISGHGQPRRRPEPNRAPDGPGDPLHHRDRSGGYALPISQLGHHLGVGEVVESCFQIVEELLPSHRSTVVDATPFVKDGADRLDLAHLMLFDCVTCALTEIVSLCG